MTMTVYRYRGIDILPLPSQAPWRWLVHTDSAPDGTAAYDHCPKAQTLREARAIIARDHADR